MLTPSSPLHSPLLALARRATAQIREASAQTAILWRTQAHPDILAWVPLAGAHPLDLLLGFVAPEHWISIGVSGAGSARALDGAGRLRPGPGLGQVFVTVLVDRSAATSTLIRRGEGEPTTVPEEPEGVVADACRRALGLPTTDPPCSTSELWALCWLDRLVEAACAGPPPSLRDWPSVASLHPAAGPTPQPCDPTALARASRVLGDAWPWSRLRAHPTDIDLPGLDLTPEVAQWMDDGMWARWLLAGLPTSEDLLASVHDLLAPDLAAAVTQVVNAC